MSISAAKLEARITNLGVSMSYAAKAVKSFNRCMDEDDSFQYPSRRNKSDRKRDRESRWK